MRTRPRTKLERVYLETIDGGPTLTTLSPLAIEMPALAFARAVRGIGGFVVDAAGWSHDATFVAVDHQLAISGADTLVVRGPAADLVRITHEVVTRCQRFIDRRNAASAAPIWDDVRTAHERLHDGDKPLVRADLDHAIDTWQWTLRLSPNASLAVQIAALFHDVERLESEADHRVEQHAPDYEAFKDRHARRGADRTYEILKAASVDEMTAARVRAIVATHERRGSDPETDLLNDADGLSFFSLNSPGYADYFGPEQTRKKVAYTLARLGPAARQKLACIRLRSDVRAHLVAVVDAFQ